MTVRRLILVLTAGLCTTAYPHSLVERGPEASDPNNSSSNTTFVIAGAVVGALCLLVASGTIYRMIKARRLAGGVRRTATQTPAEAILSANPSTANLSSTTTAPSTTSTGANANRRERRPRRTRRTPSQISTKSLPAYMEEPGDEELVLVQRATEPEEYSRSSMEAGEHSTYESRSSVDVQTPLMQEMRASMDQDEVGGDDDESQSRVSSQPNGGHRMNPSIDSVATGSADTHGSRNSTTQLLTGANDAIDERGDAPPYTEREEPPSGSPPPNNTTAGEHRSVASRIMPTGLRNLFSGTRAQPQTQVENSDSLVPMVSLTEAPAVGSNGASRRSRVDTGATIPDSGSVPALLLSRSRSPPNSRIALTRPLTNNSSSTSLHARFTHQRNRSGSSLSPSVNNADGSNARLTSPSSTSINSALISSPLVHTVTRTEFRFPKSGPTPDQLKFLSSRESLGRFGVPFGEDAERSYPSTRPPPFQATSGATSLGVGSGHGSSNSNPENMTRSEVTAPTPTRAHPTSWWRHLMQPAAAHETPKEPPSPDTANAPAAPAPAPDSEVESTSNTVDVASTAPVPELSLTSNSITTDEDAGFEPAALVPLPASARQSLVISPSLSLPSNPHDPHMEEEESSRHPRSVSRANTVSSTHTNLTYQTAADTVHLHSSSSSSSGTETEYYDNDREGMDEETPTTPTMVPQRSLAQLPAPSSIHEDIDTVSPAISIGNAVPVLSGTTVSAH